MRLDRTAIAQKPDIKKRERERHKTTRVVRQQHMAVSRKIEYNLWKWFGGKASQFCRVYAAVESRGLFDQSEAWAGSWNFWPRSRLAWLGGCIIYDIMCRFDANVQLWRVLLDVSLRAIC